MSTRHSTDFATSKTCNENSQVATNVAGSTSLAGQPSSIVEREYRDRLLSDRDVAHRYQVKKQTIWRWVKTSSTFPKPFKVEGTTRWSELELNEHDCKLKEARR